MVEILILKHATDGQNIRRIYAVMMTSMVSSTQRSLSRVTGLTAVGAADVRKKCMAADR